MAAEGYEEIGLSDLYCNPEKFYDMLPQKEIMVIQEQDYEFVNIVMIHCKTPILFNKGYLAIYANKNANGKIVFRIVDIAMISHIIEISWSGTDNELYEIVMNDPNIQLQLADELISDGNKNQYYGWISYYKLGG